MNKPKGRSAGSSGDALQSAVVEKFYTGVEFKGEVFFIWLKIK